MKKFISRALAVVLASSLAVGCAGTVDSASDTVMKNDSTVQGEKLNVVTTIFPIYDWTKVILGEDLENVILTYLANTGTDVHSYEPTVDNMVTMTDCDMFIHVGGASDAWVDAVLANAENPDMVVINLTEVLGDSVREEAEVEGMQAHDHDHDEEEHDHDHDDEEHNHDHDDEEHDHDHEDGEMDEHVWLSLKNAAIVCQYIADELATLNPAKADLYKANLAAYLNELNDLDAQYQAVVSEGTQDTLLFADRFPFLYMMEDYDLDYYAAFAGCSSETEASFETIAFLSGKIDELGLTTVVTTEDPAAGVAETVIASTATKDMTILQLDSMQAVTADEVTEGATYLGIMTSNLETITQAVE